MAKNHDNKKHKKVKVLEVGILSHNTGGVEKLLYDIFVNIDTDSVQIDFLSPDGGAYDMFEDEIEKKGGSILDLNIDRISLLSKLKYAYRLFKFLKLHDYDVVHINSGAFFFTLQCAIISKMCNIKRIIAHSHTVCVDGKLKTLIRNLLKPTMERNADFLLACSKMAALSMFTRKSVDSGKVQIIKNGIEVEKYRFKEKKRTELREEYGLDKNIVYGHVGRFIEEKNHGFLLDIFLEIQKKQNNAMLILVGRGPLEDAIREKTEKLGLEKKVVFMGERRDVEDLLNCFDAFLLPSITEGLPIVAIEAQTNGLLTVCSDAVTDETVISDTYLSIPLDNTASQWAEEIIKNTKQPETWDRSEKYKNTVKAEYDIKISAKEILDIYTRE